MGSGVKEWRFTALTYIWTGGARRQSVPRLIPLGLIGSIRWWFEVLVRGLGGAACDPSDPDTRCPEKAVKDVTKGHHCVVCELFGCTGWARKFRFEVVDEYGRPITEAIERNKRFVMRFVPLRFIREEEWALLDTTLRLIADYGALGGRTVLKPSDEPGREGLPHHRGYGLVKLEFSPLSRIKLDNLVRYVLEDRHRRIACPEFGWASLDNFWCVRGKHLAREGPHKSTFNQILGRVESKLEKERHDNRVVRYSEFLLDESDEASKWLAGRLGESKKVFSFKNPEAAKRTFGFVKPGVIGLDQMKSRLQDALGNFEPGEFLTKKDVLKALGLG